MAKKKILDGDGPHGSKLAGKHSGVGEKAKVGNHGGGSAESYMKTMAKAIIEGYSRRAAADVAGDESNEQRRGILLALHNLRGSVVNGMLSLSRIVGEYNKDRPRHARLTGGRIGYVLNKELGLTTKRGMGNLTFLLWEDAKIKRLFISMVNAYPVNSGNGQTRIGDAPIGKALKSRLKRLKRHTAQMTRQL